MYSDICSFTITFFNILYIFCLSEIFLRNFKFNLIYSNVYAFLHSAELAIHILHNVNFLCL
jgi:hypothetical protein